MSPPWEQMQFVSNLISSKLFCFPPLPLWPTWTALKGELYRHMFFCVFRYWTTGSGNHYHRAVREQHITQYFYPHPFLEKTNCK